MRIAKLGMTLAVVGSLGACAQNDGYYGRGGYGGGYGGSGMDGGTLGTLGGAVVGGLAGSRFGSGTGRLAAVAAGTLLGGYLGNQLGRRLDQPSQERAAYAERQALSQNSPVSWNSGSSYGTVTPIRSYESDGRYCREYSHQVYIDGRPEQARGTACQQADGSWRVMS